jgi:hypothetical protein
MLLAADITYLVYMACGRANMDLDHPRMFVSENGLLATTWVSVAMAWTSAHDFGDVHVSCKPPASVSSHESYMHSHSSLSYSSTNEWPIAEPRAFRPRSDHFLNLEITHLSSSPFYVYLFRDFYLTVGYRILNLGHFTIGNQASGCIQPFLQPYRIRSPMWKTPYSSLAHSVGLIATK